MGVIVGASSFGGNPDLSLANNFEDRDPYTKGPIAYVWRLELDPHCRAYYCRMIGACDSADTTGRGRCT